MTQSHSPTGPRVARIRSGEYQVVGLPQVSPVFMVRAEAQKWMRAELAKLPESRRPQQRPCLCCGATFHSEGPHHRMCNRCRLGSTLLPIASIGATASGKVRRAAGC